MDEKQLEELLRKNSHSKPSPASKRVVDRVTLRLAQRRRRKNWIQISLIASAACALITGLSIYLNSSPSLDDDQTSTSPLVDAGKEGIKPTEKKHRQPLETPQKIVTPADPLQLVASILVSENPSSSERQSLREALQKSQLNLESILNTHVKKQKLSLALQNISNLNAPDLRLELTQLAKESKSTSLAREILLTFLSQNSLESLAHATDVLNQTTAVQRLFRGMRFQWNARQKAILNRQLTASDSRSEAIRAYALLSLTKASPQKSEHIFFQGIKSCLSSTESNTTSRPATQLQELLINTQRLDPKALSKFLVNISRKENREALVESDLNPVQQELFLKTLAQIRPLGTWDYLKSQIQHFGPQAKYIESLALMGDPRTVQLIRPWIERPDSTGKRCIEALGKVPSSEALELLVQTFTHWHQYQRLHQENRHQYQLHQRTRHLAQVLNERKAEVFELLEAQLKKKPSDTQSIVTLLSLFPNEAPSKLAERVGKYPLRTQASIVRELQALNNPSALESLVHLLREPQVKRLARNALISLAREDFGSTPEAWKPWLSQQKERDNNRASHRSSSELLAHFHHSPQVPNSHYPK